MPAWTDRIAAWLRRAVRPAQPLVRAAQLWSGADGLRMSAAMSFYGILSLAPLLVIIVALLGWWLDRDVLEQGLATQIGAIVGEQGGALIRQSLDSARQPSQGIVASAIGFGVLLFGATGVFTELQEAFARLWAHGTGAPAATSWRHSASVRLRGVGYVLAFGFMLLVSLVISTVLDLFSGWAGDRFALDTLMRVLNELAAFAICMLLFMALMRISSGPKPHTRCLWIGAAMGAILFTLGRQLLAVYLSKAAVVSAYGAAGSLVVFLMWIYFSSAVLLFAAGCARAVQEARNPGPAAVKPVAAPADAPPLQPPAQPRSN